MVGSFTFTPYLCENKRIFMKKPPKISAEDAANAWQRLRTETLPGVFYAFDESESRSERVVTYTVPHSVLRHVYKKAEAEPEARLAVHLGVNPEYLTDKIPTYPAFTLFLQIRIDGDEPYADCVEMTWEPNGRFGTISPTEVDSEANAIPAAGAFLFVRSWQELPESNLATPFTATTRVLGERVKSYTFSYAESQSIFNDIGRSLKQGAEGGMAVHLGNGIAIWSHPFSFRPVVEVKKAFTDENESLPKSRMTTGLSDGDSDSFYDYSRPDPPGT